MRTAARPGPGAKNACCTHWYPPTTAPASSRTKTNTMASARPRTPTFNPAGGLDSRIDGILQQRRQNFLESARHRTTTQRTSIEHANGPDANPGVRQEGFLSSPQVLNIQHVLVRGNPDTRSFAQHDATHDPRHSAKIQSGCAQSGSIDNKHVAHGSRHQLAGAAEHKRLRDGGVRPLPTRQDLLQPVAVLQSRQRGILSESQRCGTDLNSVL